MSAKPTPKSNSPPPSLLFPFCSLTLKTPASSSPLTFPPVPTQQRLSAPLLHSHNLSTSEEAMDYNNHDSEPGGPFADIHTKAQQPEPSFDSRAGLRSFRNAFMESQRLQQVLGERLPEPYNCPVALTEGLAMTIEMYDWEDAVNDLYGNPTGLEDIIEEDEEEDIENSVPGMAEQLEGVAIGTTKNIESEQRPGTSDTAVEGMNSGELDDDLDALFGSTVTLVEDQYTEPKNLSVSSGSFMEPQVTLQVQTNTALGGLSGNQGLAQQTKHSYTAAQRAVSLPHICIPAAHDPPRHFEDTHDKENISTWRRSFTAPEPLFPSPTVESDPSWEFYQNDDNDLIPRAFAPTDSYAPISNARKRFRPVLYTLTEQQEPDEVPQIIVQSPSPKKRADSRKRSAPSRDFTFGSLLSRKRTENDVTGLPVLPAHVEYLWKKSFPGNTPSLLTILLPWSLTMQSVHARIQDPYMFSRNPSFPYPIQPPVGRNLVSVAFYDTSVTPHKEIRFIGPGDVASMSYNEVDVFAEPNIEEEPIYHTTFGAGLRSAFGASNPSITNNVRWAYILLQGHPDPTNPAQPVPHMILAWHLDAVTARSQCLHILCPDDSTASSSTTPPAAPAKPGRSVLETLLRNPLRFQRALREASSAAAMEPASPAFEPRGDALTLQREVLVMGKAGRIPLVEGFRVDVKRWKEWLGAVGKGAGKIVVWGERVVEG